LNVLKPNKQTTIQTLLALGKGHREIARAVRRNTELRRLVARPDWGPLAFWWRKSPSKNLAQGKRRTQLWWHCV